MGFWDWFIGRKNEDDDNEEPISVSPQDVNDIDDTIHDEEFDDWVGTGFIKDSKPGAYEADELDYESPGGPITEEVPAFNLWDPRTWRR
jgi:hypothetical protein